MATAPASLLTHAKDMAASETLTANLPGEIQFAYLDSGPVPNSDDFTTLVVIHGLHFNAYGFKHLFPLAHKYNLRLVLVQRRDYAGSSKFTEEEMGTLQGNPKAFFQKAGASLIDFLHYLVKNTRVCQPSPDRLRGGISILSWSLGTAYAIPIFLQSSMVDKAAYAAVEPYFTTLIAYDPPFQAMGLQPEGDMLWGPFLLPPEQWIDAFRLWVSSYYDQPPKWDESLATLDARQGTQEKFSVKSWTPDQFNECTQYFPQSEFSLLINPTVISQLGEITTEVFLNPDSQAVTDRTFPRSHVAYIHGRHSMWMASVNRHLFEKKRSELIAQGHGQNLRPVFFKDVEWGNHFIHYENPEEFVKMVVECLRS